MGETEAIMNSLHRYTDLLPCARPGVQYCGAEHTVMAPPKKLALK
jgi:hypothetical protein